MATKRKFSAAQLEAQRLFAQRAKSGELAKERKHHQASGKRRKANPSDDDMTAAQWAQRMADLRLRKPSSVKRMFGSKGPTAEQYAQYQRNLKAWNREYRYASKMQKIALERDNAAFERAAKKNPNRPVRQRSKAQNLRIAMEEQRAGHPRKAKEFFERAAKSKNPAPNYPAPKGYNVLVQIGRRWVKQGNFGSLYLAEDYARSLHRQHPAHAVKVIKPD